MPNPLVLPAIIAAIPQLLQLLFGGPKTKQEQDTTQRTETVVPPRQPRSALYSRLEAPIVQMLLGQFKRTQGAGYPGGQGLGMNDMINQLMKMLSGNWQEIMAGDTKSTPTIGG